MGTPRACGPGGTPLDPSLGSGQAVRNDPRPQWRPLVRDFDEVQQVTLAATMGGVFAPICSYHVPDGQQGYWYAWGQDVTTAGSFQDVAWRLCVNNEVRLSYPRIAQVSTLIAGALTDLHIFVSSGQTLTVEGSNNNAATRQVSARIKGFFWPEQYERS